MNGETNKPKQYLQGNLKINEWSNTRDGNEYKSYTIEKIYKQDDEWKSTQNFTFDELCKIPFLVSSVYDKVKPLKE